MKIAKILSVTVLATGLGLAGVFAGPNTTQAAAKSTLKTFPKSFRHNWYASAGKRGNAIKITAKKAAMRYDANSDFAHFQLHARKLPLRKIKTKYKWSWIYAKKQHGTIHIALWDNTVNLPLEGNYKVKTKTYKNRKIKVLQEVSGGQVNYSYYTTKKLASHFNK